MTPSELDRLADYAEGLLDGTPDGEAVAARIATDQEWADAYRQLSAVVPGISADLAALPEVPMPTSVAASIENALASAPPADDRADDRPAAWVPPDPDELHRLRAEKARRDRASRRWRVAGGWVAAAALVGALCTGLGQLVTSSSSDDSDTSAASSANKESAPDVLSAPAAPPSTRVSGVAYSTARLGQQARALVDQPAPRPASDAPEPGTSGPVPGASAPEPGASAVPSVPGDRQTAAASSAPAALRRLTSPTELRNCLTALGITIEPVAVDYATLDGAPAVVVVTEGTDANRFAVVAAGPDCGVNGNGDELTRTSVSR